MTEKKRGRPRVKEVAIWEEKYYKLSDMRDNQAIRKTIEERLYNGYAAIFTLANDREPNQKDVGTINKAVNAIIERI
jgi:hypothetical protein